MGLNAGDGRKVKVVASVRDLPSSDEQHGSTGEL